MDWQHRPRCDQVPAWAALQAHHAQHFAPGRFDLRQAFAADAQRVPALGFDAPQLFADLSKSHIDAQALTLLVELAEQCGLPAQRDALLHAAPVNVSEGRPATHPLWRCPDEAALQALPPEAAQIARQAAQQRQQMQAFAEGVRAQGRITDVVNLGIGGSDLGPRLVVQALFAAGQVDGPRLHFVSNMDGHDLGELLPQLKPHSTLFIVASKTFGTAETLQNARSARAWFDAAGGSDAAQHFVAVSANAEAARAFGAGPCFGFDAGVGGRYSLWSSIGLPIALAVGAARFELLLAGAHAMDRHFAQAPLARNLPVLLALLDVWNRNLLGHASRCVAPYHHGLRRLPAYLQQLEMESNGKRVDVHGGAVTLATAPVTWGEVGSNAQHAFFQMLHQGCEVVPVEFVLVRDCSHSLPGHHEPLLANALAQSRALMLGQSGDAPERHFPGNRPSTTLLLPDLGPRSVGALLALYEHRTFALGALWGINSFDQWGVELGKRHAGPILAALQGQGPDVQLDASTRALLGRLRQD